MKSRSRLDAVGKRRAQLAKVKQESIGPPDQLEKALLDSYKAKPNILSRKMIGFYFYYFASLRFVKVEERNFSMRKPPASLLCFDNLFKIFTRGQSLKSVIFSRKVIRLFIFTLISYTVLKIYFVALAQHQRDYLNAVAKPKLRINANRTTNCSSKDDIYFENQFLYEQLIKFTKLLDYFGDPFISLTGGASALFDSRTVYSFLYYYWTMIYLSYKKLRADHLGFIFSPILELRRVRHQLAALIQQFDSRSMNNNAGKQSNDFEKYKGIVKASKKDNLYLVVPETNLPILPQDYFKSMYPQNLKLPLYQFKLKANLKGAKLARSYSRSLLLKPQDACISSLSLVATSSIAGDILADPNFPNLIQPANLTVDCFNWINTIYRVFLIIFMAGASVLGVILNAALLKSEIVTRIEHRLGQFKCLAWMPENGTLISDYTQIDPLESSWEIETYQSYDGSLSGYVDLFMIEVNHMFNLRTLICTLQFQTLTFLDGVLVIFYLAILVASHEYKTIWLEQINDQINHIKTLLRDRQLTMDFASGALSPIDGHITNDNELLKVWGSNEEKVLKKKNEIVMRSLLVAYFNYELFRRSLGDFKHLVNFLLVYQVIISFFMLIICYIIGTYINASHNPVLIASAGIVVIVNNVNLFICARFTSKHRKLLRNIMEMITTGSQESKEFFEVIKFWRNQVISDSDAKLLCSPNIMSIQVSYKFMMNINAYLILLCVVLYKNVLFALE